MTKVSQIITTIGGSITIDMQFTVEPEHSTVSSTNDENDRFSVYNIAESLAISIH